MKIIILFLLSFSVLASGRHDHDIEVDINNTYHETINNYYDVTELTEITEITEVTEINQTSSNSDYNRAIALSLANNTPFDYVTHQLQTSINAARYEGETGLNLGIAKRFKSIDALFYGAYSRSGSEKGVSAGAVFRW